MLELTEIHAVRAWATAMVARARAAGGDRGYDEDRGERGEIAQTVIIVAILAAAAIAIATIIATKFTDKANSIPTN